jgi:hypothetical protein
VKYDEKTGEQVPESRIDEIKLSFEALKKLADSTNGTFDRQVEVAWLLRDIDQSLGLLVDMIGMMLAKILKEEEPDAPVQ